ncbi:MAG: ABC transporter transmembrane domain-containing protein, partial [Opitutales bacterium]|nr:ABC transporter transmembrane domain-containing protein [Opitutales bacterium]
MPTPTAETTETQSELKLLRELFADKLWAGVKAIFFITLKAAPVWLIPLVTARVIDLANQPEPDITKLIIYIIIGIGLFLQNIPAAVYFTKNLILLTRGIGRDLRIKVCHQLQALSLHYHNRHSVGKVHSKAIRDIEIIEQLPRLALEQGFSFFLGVSLTAFIIYIRKPEALLFFIPAAAAGGVVSASVSYTHLA